MIQDYEQRLLKKNKVSHRPWSMLFLDTETKTTTKDDLILHRMKMAWTCYILRKGKGRQPVEKWTYWNNTENLNQYIEKLTRPKTKLYVFGHNIFFDLQASDFFHYFTKWGWILDFVYDKGLTYILKIHKDSKTITILSTTNFYPVSLKILGDLIGIPKLDVDFNTTPESDMIEYCKQDVEIIKATIEKWIAFIDLHDLGNFALSRASQALTAYRHRFMDTKINLHEEEEIIDFERDAYFGGRTECHYIGKCKQGPFISLDINSMYPFVMKLKQYPTRLIDYCSLPSRAKVRSTLWRFLVTAEVELETDEPAYAVRHNGRIVFPIGDFRAFLSTPGLDYALEKGHVKKVLRMAVYEKANIFTAFVDYFYDLKHKYKKDGNRVMEDNAKKILCSLYGKFAQKSPLIEMEEDITFDGYYRREIPDLTTGKVEIITKLFNKLLIEFGSEPAKTAFCAISAHVTEYARFYLWDIMKEVGVSRILYCDTDSIKIRKSDLPRVKTKIDDYELGALKIEGETENLHIYAPKDYETDTEKVLKGVPSHAVKLSENEYAFDHFPKQSTHLRKEVTRYFITRPMIKVLKREYKKGIVMPSGKVKPLVFQRQ